MRNMSFIHTKQQIYDGTKTETTRKGWTDAKPGDRIMAIEQGMGLKKGEKIKRIRVIEVVKNEQIQVRLKFYKKKNVVAEGFLDLTPKQFIRQILFAKCKCRIGEEVNRITFKYV